jgi:hypothetical protein
MIILVLVLLLRKPVNTRCQPAAYRGAFIL